MSRVSPPDRLFKRIFYNPASSSWWAGFSVVMPPPFYLVGPTAVGKTSLAVEVAARCGAEIIGADAFQVYSGLDLLTAKPTVAERQRVPHHLIGVLPLSAGYNVARYVEDAQRCLGEIAARGRSAIIVGGSGLYVRALSHGLSVLPPAHPDLRDELEKCDEASLVARLQQLDPAALEVIDTRNKRRLVRAIEICETTGRPFSAFRERWEQAAPASARNGYFLIRDRQELRARITRRVQAMVPAGVLEEVRQAGHHPFSTTSARIIGLADLHAHLLDGQDLATCLQAIEIATHQYAKRQMTWFRGKSDFTPLDLSTLSEEEVIARAVARIQSG